MGLSGYSVAPLAKKLGIAAGHTVVLLGRPPKWDIPALPDGVHVTGTGIGDADVVVAFCPRRIAVETVTPHLVAHLKPASSAWIAWPRRAGGHHSDITEDLLRELILPTGLVDVKVAALDLDWSGLKFVWRKELRTPP